MNKDIIYESTEPSIIKMVVVLEAVNNFRYISLRDKSFMDKVLELSAKRGIIMSASELQHSLLSLSSSCYVEYGKRSNVNLFEQDYHITEVGKLFLIQFKRIENKQEIKTFWIPVIIPIVSAMILAVGVVYLESLLKLFSIG